jgi:hypothetical protein
MRCFITGDSMMIAEVLLKKGDVVPRHAHHNEQSFAGGDGFEGVERVPHDLRELSFVGLAGPAFERDAEGGHPYVGGEAGGGVADAAPSQGVGERSVAAPQNSTSRLSAKRRKNVRSVRPARSAISATVVSSNPRSRNSSSAARSRRPRASGSHWLMGPS